MLRRAAALGAALAVSAGCSGSDRLSHTEFVDRANRVCAKRGREIARIPRPGALILYADYLEKALPLARMQRTELDELAEPERDEKHVRSLLAAWDDVLAALDVAAEAATGGSDIGIVQSLRRAAAAETRADRAARRLALSACTGFNPITPET